MAKTEQDPIARVFESREQTRAFYDKISKFYDLLAEHSEQPVRQAGLELLAAAPGESILEIGCGTGRSLEILAEKIGPGGRLCAIDLSPKMLEVAEARLVKANLADRVALACGDACGLPYSSNAFDGVFMSFTLELFDTPEIPRVLAECQRVLKAGGRIVVVGMSKESRDGLMVKAFEWTHEHFPNFLDCRPIFVRRALEQAGFEIKRVEKKSMWVPVEIVLGMKPDR